MTKVVTLGVSRQAIEKGLSGWVYAPQSFSAMRFGSVRAPPARRKGAASGGRRPGGAHDPQIHRPPSHVRGLRARDRMEVEIDDLVELPDAGRRTIRRRAPVQRFEKKGVTLGGFGA